ncbi:Aminopeptidase N [Orchesella cincta]|uniref:Aminopeptidase N n=1 Tax=Orchesella cincta TaxID=48709 RepID=A0A1D2N7Q6_ORCCI|nr:Aminopeptidase N [Orchesella cincta]
MFNLPGWYWDHYSPTPVMSSYLLALVVSDFTCVSEHPIKYDKRIEVCGPPHMIAKGGGKHSTEVVATVLKYYDGFMKQKYPLPKMTSVAIPDFLAGITSESDRLWIDLVIAHELAHQNFGNLVTTKLWNQIYLNEGLATYISYFGLQSVSPEFEPEKEWIASYRREALSTDGIIDTHPIVNISNPKPFFDEISYSKGASLIKMMENFLTREVLHESLQFYLAEHAYNTVTQWDLFEVIERHAFTHGVNPPVASITEIMESWTLQPGYPVIRVDFISNQMIALSQERFFDQPPQNKLHPQFWYVPIITLTDKTKFSLLEKRLPTTWLSSTEPTKVLFIDEEFEWIVINNDGSGFARVLYDDALIRRIQKYLSISPQIFSALTRAQIIEDSFELAWAGYSRLETALDLTKYLGNEHEPIVWSAALNGFGKIYAMLVDDEAAFASFKEYVYKKISASLSITGVEQLVEDRGVSVLHRASMLTWGGMLQVSEAMNYANKLVMELISTASTSGVPPDLHAQTYCNAIIGGDRDVYHSLLSVFHIESNNDIKDMLARSLGCSNDANILEELQRNVTSSNTGFSVYQRSQILLKLAKNPLSRKTILSYLDENFEDLRNLFDGPKTIVRTLENAAQYWNTDKQLQQLLKFLAKYKDEFSKQPKLEKSIKKIMNQVEKNIIWLQKFAGLGPYKQMKSRRDERFRARIELIVSFDISRLPSKSKVYASKPFISLLRCTNFSIILCSTLWLCLAEFIPPVEKEWDNDLYPNVFSDFPKERIDETKYKVKSGPDPDPTHKYLPPTTKPISYDLTLRIILDSELDEEELTAPGSVNIRIKCLEATDQIVMHADVEFVTIIPDSVKVEEAIFGKPTNRTIPVKNQTFEINNDFYIIHLATPCKVNWEYFVNIGFIAQIATEEFTGLYLSTYRDPVTNITRRLATTQFEAEHARKMFPNYDEPDKKATFKLTIGRPENLNSLSNMIITKTEKIKNLPGWYWDHYSPTPVMSSYLVALVVSDFTCVSEHPIKYDKYIEVCGPPHMIAKGGGKHSTEVVATVLKYYDGFMKQKYPLPKMTSVAIPDFQAGAMENWYLIKRKFLRIRLIFLTFTVVCFHRGLNTYRIRGLIYYPGITSESDRLRIDLTIAHELAHQNFGNLVTNKLWNQIYLNEGFATYISYFGLQSISPEYEPEKQWMASYRRKALLIDGSIDTHPMVNVSNPKSFFDGVSYSKGASLITMMENFLTREVLHEALQFYLAAHAYDTATQWDLFEVIERHAFTHGVYPPVASITEIMESWTLQPDKFNDCVGYPVIRVDFISNQMIALSQERFFDKPPEDRLIPQFWYVPIITLTDKTKFSFLEKRLPNTWLSNTEPTKVLFIDEEFEWIVINKDASVFARVLYDDALIRRIQKYLSISPKIFSALTRAQIIEDSFELAWAGYSRLETALDLTKYLGNEHEPIVWSAALNGLGKIYAMLVDDEAVFASFKEYVYKKISASLSITGVEQLVEDRGVSVLHRASMLTWGGVLQVSEAINYANKLVQELINSASTSRVPPDLHSQTYCNAIIGGNKDVYHRLLSVFHAESDNDIKDILARSLGCSNDINILEELQKNITDSSSGVSPYHNSQILLKLARNPLTRKTILNYLDENFEDLRDLFDGPKVIVRTLEHAAQYWNTDKQLQRLLKFLAKYKDEFPKLEKSLKRIITQVEKNLVWMEKFAEPVKIWLTTNK